MKTHTYQTNIEWTGNLGNGTESYKSYSRNHRIHVGGKPHINASADPSFLGDSTKYNPEELLIASLSGCHMLWYLHICSVHGISVAAYQDEAEGVMAESDNGSGKFVSVTLRPIVTIQNGSDKSLAMELHDQANKRCFIANSCSFPVHHKPVILTNNEAGSSR